MVFERKQLISQLQICIQRVAWIGKLRESNMLCDFPADKPVEPSGILTYRTAVPNECRNIMNGRIAVIYRLSTVIAPQMLA